MEQSTKGIQTMDDYISIYERPKTKLGRPNGTCKFTDEKRKQHKNNNQIQKVL